MNSRMGVLVAAALVAGLSWTATLTPSPVAAASGKVTICHRTHSRTNPYRRITVSQNAVQNARHGGHGLPIGSANPAVYDSTFLYAPTNKYWGDIIPGGDAEGLTYNGTTQIALNWTAAGKADFTSYCAAMTPTNFYDAEIAAGQVEADILADLNDQAANEDAALLASLGGSFTAGNLSTWTTAVTVTTGAATQLTTTTATLSGSLTVGSTSTVPNFRYGTSSTLATYTTAAATPSPVTNTTTVTGALTGLLPGTTYYYMVTGTTNAGADTEGILTGSIQSFTTAAETPTTTSSTTTTSTTTTVPATTTSTSTTTSTTTTVPASSTTTTTSTTVPATTVPATTTTSPNGPPIADGGVHGVVWFDRNHNGLFDGNEWVLPGVTVVLDEGGSFSTETLRTQAAPIHQSAVTAADGSYFFGGLFAGSYQVTATAIIKGFDYTSDTDGATDWKVAVAVVANAVSTADFAGIGRGQLIGQVFDSATLEGIPGALITCRWSGYDDVLGNADDVTFTITADATGSFDMAGIPYGNFTCSGRDPVSDRQSSSVVSNVFSPEAVLASLPVGSVTSGRSGTGATLPTTGSDNQHVVLLSLLFVALGSVTVLATRRRSTR